MENTSMQYLQRDGDNIFVSDDISNKLKTMNRNATNTIKSYIFNTFKIILKDKESVSVDDFNRRVMESNLVTKKDKYNSEYFQAIFGTFTYDAVSEVANNEYKEFLGENLKISRMPSNENKTNFVIYQLRDTNTNEVKGEGTEAYIAIKNAGFNIIEVEDVKYNVSDNISIPISFTKDKITKNGRNYTPKNSEAYAVLYNEGEKFDTPQVFENFLNQTYRIKAFENSKNPQEGFPSLDEYKKLTFQTIKDKFLHPDFGIAQINFGGNRNIIFYNQEKRMESTAKYHLDELISSAIFEKKNASANEKEITAVNGYIAKMEVKMQSQDIDSFPTVDECLAKVEAKESQQKAKAPSL